MLKYAPRGRNPCPFLLVTPAKRILLIIQTPDDHTNPPPFCFLSLGPFSEVDIGRIMRRLDNVFPAHDSDITEKLTTLVSIHT